MENEEEKAKDTPAEAPKLISLSNVEKVVNEYAKVLAGKQNVRPEHIEVILSRDLGAIMKLQAGSPVRIYLQWPEAQPNINTLLLDAFSLIRRYPIRRSFELVPVAYVRTERNEIRKAWRKEKFTDESEIVLDLIPRQRLRVRETVTTEIIDTVTGETVSTTRSGKTDRFEGDAIGLWMQLSRQVRDKYPEEEIADAEIETVEPKEIANNE